MVLAEFYEGTAPAIGLPIAGPSVWPYVETVRDGRSGGLSPEIPVVLHGPLNWCKTQAILDSGADVTAIPYGWAGPLGVDLDKARPVTAWGNGALAEYLVPRERLRLEIAGLVIDVEPYFTPWEHLVLGRDVFRHFRVVFDERAQTVVLDPYEAS